MNYDFADHKNHILLLSLSDQNAVPAQKPRFYKELRTSKPENPIQVH